MNADAVKLHSENILKNIARKILDDVGLRPGITVRMRWYNFDGERIEPDEASVIDKLEIGVMFSPVVTDHSSVVVYTKIDPATGYGIGDRYAVRNTWIAPEMRVTLDGTAVFVAEEEEMLRVYFLQIADQFAHKYAKEHINEDSAKVENDRIALEQREQLRDKIIAFLEDRLRVVGESAGHPLYAFTTQLAMAQSVTAGYRDMIHLLRTDSYKKYRPGAFRKPDEMLDIEDIAKKIGMRL
jgi:hypothetical protein